MVSQISERTGIAWREKLVACRGGMGGQIFFSGSYNVKDRIRFSKHVCVFLRSFSKCFFFITRRWIANNHLELVLVLRHLNIECKKRTNEFVINDFLDEQWHPYSLLAVSFREITNRCSWIQTARMKAPFFTWTLLSFDKVWLDVDNIMAYPINYWCKSF